MTIQQPPGATPIDHEEAEDLILTHLTTRGEICRWEQDNILEAAAWVEKTRPTDIFNEAFIRNLHHRMFCNIWRWAGEFRHTDKNIGGPWYQIPMRIRNLCDDAMVWLDVRDQEPDEMAVHLHHRLVVIHAFPNGNGRHARMMTDIFLENILGRPRFTWGGKNLDDHNKARQDYLCALIEADDGHFQDLLDFVRS